MLIFYLALMTIAFFTICGIWWFHQHNVWTRFFFFLAFLVFINTSNYVIGHVFGLPCYMSVVIQMLILIGVDYGIYLLQKFIHDATNPPKKTLLQK